MTPRSKADWQAIEAAYRAGKLTTAEIARQFGVTEGAIRQRAKRNEWKRETPTEADRVETIREELICIPQQQHRQGPESAPHGDNLFAEPQTPVEAILTHRRAAAQARALSSRLLIELEEQTTQQGLIDHLIELAFKGEGLNGAAIRAGLRDALSIHQRAKTLVNISNALSALVKLEREAFGIGPVAAIEDPVERHNLEVNRETGARRSKDEIARAILDMIERASREKAGRTMQ